MTTAKKFSLSRLTFTSTIFLFFSLYISLHTLTIDDHHQVASVITPMRSISCFDLYKKKIPKRERRKEKEEEEENRIFMHIHKIITAICCIDNHVRKICIFILLNWRKILIWLTIQFSIQKSFFTDEWRKKKLCILDI
jgi:hypothetical protein